MTNLLRRYFGFSARRFTLSGKISDFCSFLSINTLNELSRSIRNMPALGRRVFLVLVDAIILPISVWLSLASSFRALFR